MVTPIPNEPFRFWVQSSSRPEMLHTVDLQWQESPHSKPIPGCSCEDHMARGNPCCKHMTQVAAYILTHEQNLYQATA